ncbi:unnamed protein product [Caenorhabditis auriculariae]|uniref:Uncharacterized protein n=1 Tax=Caenorhabditis auriculariae TaxID=2777116 RepID=A0A8S1H341_9PELO|nr:unnamed protein product [Caenorhabditis auriculariae]
MSLHRSPRISDPGCRVWSLYRPASSRAKRKGSRPPEQLNVSMEDIENRNRLEPGSPKTREIERLQMENFQLKETIEKQGKKIKELMEVIRRMNSLSEVESSDSQNLERSSASVVPIQRVTPSKRESSSSSSRRLTEDVTTPRSSSNSDPQRTPTNGPTAPRPRRNLFTTSREVKKIIFFCLKASHASSDSSPALFLPRPAPGSNQIPPSARNIQPARSRISQQRREEIVSELRADRRREARERHLLDEGPATIPRRRTVAVTSPQNLPGQVQIEALGNSVNRDSTWAQASPVRLFLEQNKPEFIRRMQLRQQLIRMASNRRSELEAQKREAARAVVVGAQHVTNVRNVLFTDSTNICAFSEQEIRDLTKRNIQKSGDYKHRMGQKVMRIDALSNQILAKAFSVRVRRRSSSAPEDLFSFEKKYLFSILLLFLPHCHVLNIEFLYYPLFFRE